MLEDIIAGGASALGISLPEDASDRYRRYFEALSEANRGFNLTAILGEDEAARLHLLDSLGLFRAAELRGRIIDVGTGGGLPGVALKIARPGLHMTLLDATEKKIAFLDGLTLRLGIPCRCVAARAEELGRTPEHREMYDFAVSRAVARLNVLAELCMPFVSVGGKFLAMKAAGSDEEISEATTAIEKLGGRLSDTQEYIIPGTDIVRRVVIVEKLASTPDAYPRRWAAINKKAL